MGYHILTHRAGRFADWKSPAEKLKPRSTERFVPALVEMGRGILMSLEYAAAKEAILKLAQEVDPSAHYTEALPEESLDMDIAPKDAAVMIAPWSAAGRNYYETKLPRLRMGLAFGEVQWVLRCQASFNAGPLDDDRTLSKLWWNFEGIPIHRDRYRLPGIEAAKHFIGLAQKMEAEATPCLFEAYRAALAEVTGRDTSGLALAEPRLRVTLAEDQSWPVRRLMDAQRSRKDSISAVDRIRYPLGLEAFESFVTAVLPGARFNDKAIYFCAPKELSGDAQGLLCNLWNKGAGAKEMIGLALQAQRSSFEDMSQEHIEKWLDIHFAAPHLGGFVMREETLALVRTLQAPAPV